MYDMERMYMKRKRNYKKYLYTIAYIMLLRVVLQFTVGMSMFRLGMVFDLVVMMFWVGIFAAFIKSNTAQKVYYIIVVLVTTVFVVGDSVYFDYFGVISARSSFSGLKWLQEGNTLEYDITIPLVAYLITPPLVGVIYLIITNKRRDVFHLRDFGILSGVFVVQVALFLIWGNQTFERRIDFYRSDAFLFETMHDRILYSEKYGYYNYHLLDLTRIRPKQNQDTLKAEVDAYFESLPAHRTNDYSDRYAGYNVVMIVGETLETRFIDENLTPHLYEMYANGLTFDNYFTTVFQQGATCNSEFMGMSGLATITTNDWSSNICDAYSENVYPYALPAQLRDSGYDTYYFHSGYEWFYNRREMVPNYGYDTVMFQEDLIANGHPDFYDRFDTEMRYFWEDNVDFSNPFMMTLLTYSMHGAYNQSEFEKHADQLEAAYPNHAELDPEIRNYMLKLIEFDEMVGLLTDKLEEEGVLDSTLFVIYPDHYPYMMDYDTYTDYIGVDADDFHEVMRQRLVIYATDMTGEVIHTAASTIDVTPTVLNMINSNLVFDYFMGTDVLSTDENYVIFADLTITDGTNFLYLDETYYGNSQLIPTLEEALADEITMLEIQKDLLNADYFREDE